MRDTAQRGLLREKSKWNLCATQTGELDCLCNNSFPFFVRANCEGRKKIIFCITQLSLSKENDLVKFVDSEHYLSHAVCVVDHHAL